MPMGLDIGLDLVLGVGREGTAPLVDFNFASDPAYYRAAGYSGSSWAAVPGSSYTAASPAVRYGTTTDGVLVPFAANVPRIVPGVGVLIEGTATNKAVQSSTFQSGSWAATNLTSADSSVEGPDCLTSASLVTIGTTDAAHFYQTIAVVAGSPYTFSFYAKLGTLPADQYFFAVYDASNAAFISQDNTGVQGAVNASGYVRGSYTFTAPAGCTSVRIYPFRQGGVHAQNGKTFMLFGVQLEGGQTATSYIPTSGAAVTKSADVLNVTVPAITWPITVLTQFTPFLSATVYPYIWGLSDGTTNNQAAMYLEPAVNRWPYTAVTSGGVSQGGAVTAGSTSYTIGQSTKVAVRLETNNRRGAHRGVLGALDAADTLPGGATQLHIGSMTLGNVAAAVIERVVIYPYAMTDAQLQALTA